MTTHGSPIHEDIGLAGILLKDDVKSNKKKKKNSKTTSSLHHPPPQKKKHYTIANVFPYKQKSTLFEQTVVNSS